MPEYTYTARSLDGERVSGTLSAATEREVIHQLSGKSLFPITVAPLREKKSVGLRGWRINDQTQANFFSSLASLLRGGVPLLRSLKILQAQANNQRLRTVLDDIVTRVEGGETVGDAFARYPNDFNEITVNLARAGAEGGFLEDAFERVGQFIEHRSDIKGRTVGALIYPAILAGVGSMILVVLLIFFIPKFGELFEELRQRGQLPAATDWLLSFSSNLQKFGIPLAVVLAVLLGVLWVQLKKPAGRRAADWLKLRLPLFGSVFRNLAVARFCRVLGTLLKNGVPLIKSLEISREATGNRVLSEAIDKATENVTAGESLAVPLKRSGHFPPTVSEMISVAEESNTLDTVLVSLADGLEKQTMRRLDLLVRMLEPLMLVVMATIIMIIVVALLLPILKMGQAFS